MPTRFALCTALTLAVLAAPASALAADTVVPSSVAASTTVPAGGSSTLTLRCPGTAVALNAAVTRRGAGVTVRRSIPGAGSGLWRFRLSATPGARSRGVRAVLRCVRLRLPAGTAPARLFVSTRRPPAIRVPAGTSSTLEVRCPAGYLGTGYGFERGARRDLTLGAAEPKAGGWDFRTENGGDTPASARLSVRCLKRTVDASRAGAPTQLDFAVARLVFSDLVGQRPGSGGAFRHTCARRQFSVATGHVLDFDDPLLVTGGGPVGPRRGRWTFRRASADDVMTSFLVCLGRRSQFG